MEKNYLVREFDLASVVSQNSLHRVYEFLPKARLPGFRIRLPYHPQ
jgi:hypothetical protein